LFPDDPMNESVAQAGNATIPATARADQNPTPAGTPVVVPKLVVLRGLKINFEYPIYEGRNTVGRFADKPVDIDLVCQESTEQIWCSRQHAVIVLDKGAVLIEDLNSLNGTWVNGVRLAAGQPRPLRAGDVVQVGTVQMKLVIG
jgi:pSer/pThr/pTyr-binding forkhead associated (FHA) protein